MVSLSVFILNSGVIAGFVSDSGVIAGFVSDSGVINDLLLTVVSLTVYY